MNIALMIIILVFSQITLASHFPVELPDEDFFITRMFSDFKNYMVQLSRNSVIEYPDNNCRIYNNADKVFSFCIQRTITENKIVETLKFMVNNIDAGAISFTRKGENLKITPNSDLFKFIVPISSGTNGYRWSFDSMDLKLDIKHTGNNTIAKFLFSAPEKSVEIDLTEMEINDTFSRNYSMRCPSISGDHCSSLQIMTAINSKGQYGHRNTDYYFSNVAGRVAPVTFKTMIANTLVATIGEFSVGMLNHSKTGLNWPD